MTNCVRCLLLLWAISMAATGASAATYYVRTDGNNGNAGTANTSGGAWLTIDFAAGAASDGDTVRVQAGTYAERVTPNVNGVTFVADGVLGSVILDGIDLSDGNSRMKFINFWIDPATTGSQENGCVTVTGTASFMEFWHCLPTNGAANAFRVVAPSILTNSIVVGCVMRDFGTAADPGSAVGFSVVANDLLMLGCEISNARPDGVATYGKRWRILNLYVWGLSEAEGGHTDVFQVGSHPNGWEQHLIEGTFYIAGQAAPDEHFSQFSHGQTAHPGVAFGQNVLRRNVLHSTGSGGIGINQTSEGAITNIYVYNHTYVEACRGVGNTTTRYGDAFFGTLTDRIYYKNNLLWEAWGAALTSNLEAVYTETSVFESDYNLAYDPDGNVTFHAMWSNQANEQSNVNPLLVDVDNDNFLLGSGSGAQNTGGWLTGVSSASSSGTTFTVTNAGYFRGDNAAMTQYGGNLVVGDTITVGTDVLTIDSISGNDITVTSSFAWTAGDKVYFGGDTTPDIGAYPFGHTKLTSATHSSGTVTPNGDTRLVVQFRSGIPLTVDNSSPYEFTHQSGDEYRAYALYPSDTPWVLAVEEGGGEGIGPAVQTLGISAGQASGGRAF